MEEYTFHEYIYEFGGRISISAKTQSSFEDFSGEWWSDAKLIATRSYTYYVNLGKIVSVREH